MAERDTQQRQITEFLQKLQKLKAEDAQLKLDYQDSLRKVEQHSETC